MNNMTTSDAMKAIRAIAEDKLTTGEMFEIYDIVCACNMQGWIEGRDASLKVFAPDAYRALNQIPKPEATEAESN